MSLLDVSIVNVALPTIRTSLGASESDLQWIVSGYALTFGLVLVPAGRFGDARGRRDVFVLGVGLFTLASAAAGLAPSAGLLITARLLQGIGAGIMHPQISGLIQQLFRGAERGRAFGWLGTTIGISTAVGPLLGGILIQLAGSPEGWRWIFFVNLPIGLLAIGLAFRVIPGYLRRAARRESMDPLGVLLLGTGVLLVLLPLIEARNWSVGRIALLTVAGLAALTAFVGWERRYARHREPVVDLSLFRLRSYTLGVVIGLVYFAGFTAIFLAFTVYLQLGLDYSALAAGAALTPFSLGSAVAALVGGRIVTRFGRRVVATGLTLVTLGVGGSALGAGVMPDTGAIWLVAAPLLIAGFGSGLVISPNVTLTLAEVPVARAGSASGVLQTGQRLGSAIGIASVGSVFFAAAAHGNWGSAYWHAMLVTIALIVTALAAALLDLRLSRRPPAGSGGRRRTSERAE
jgi:EmrB/QacA subfamily drug resistance transporter